MPVRSLRSSVHTWPSRTTVLAKTQEWSTREAPKHAGLLKLGLFGSYARGDAGVGSDLDLIAVVRESRDPPERRSLSWDLLALPLPAELLVYTADEWERMFAEDQRFARTVEAEAIWLFVAPGG